MPYASALSVEPDTVRAARETAGTVAKDLGQAPDVALVFLTGPHLPAALDLAAAIRDELEPMILVGVGAVGVVGGDREVEERPAVSLWAGIVDGVSGVRFTAQARGGSVHIDGPSASVLGGAHTLVILPDPFTFPVGGLVERLAEDHPDLEVVGGLASAGHRPGENLLILDDDVFDDGAVGFLLSGSTRVTTVVSQGCRPVGRPLVVTKSEGNMVYELAGRRAYDQLVDLLGGMDDRDRRLASQGLHVGRVIDEHKTEFERGDFLIRGVIGVDEDTGAVAVGDMVLVGSTLQFQVRDAESADEDLRTMMEGRSADGALLFTCNGRGTNMFLEPDHDASLVSKVLGAPLAGMFCAGEVGPVGGRSFVHGFTASLALFEDVSRAP